MKKTSSTKRVFYIALFTFLGVMLQFLLHAAFEMWYIGLLLSDFTTYSLGFSWDALWTMHHIASVILLVASVAFGLWQGIFWWKRVGSLELRSAWWERIYNRKKDT